MSNHDHEVAEEIRICYKTYVAAKDLYAKAKRQEKLPIDIAIFVQLLCEAFPSTNEGLFYDFSLHLRQKEKIDTQAMWMYVHQLDVNEGKHSLV